MKRGELWSVSDRGYTGKPRPALIVQNLDFPALDSVTICALTTDDVSAPLVRIAVAPAASNGLRERYWVMVDKVSTVRVARIGRRLGRLEPSEIAAVDGALRLFLQLG